MPSIISRGALCCPRNVQGRPRPKERYNAFYGSTKHTQTIIVSALSTLAFPPLQAFSVGRRRSLSPWANGGGGRRAALQKTMPPTPRLIHRIVGTRKSQHEWDPTGAHCQINRSGKRRHPWPNVTPPKSDHMALASPVIQGFWANENPPLKTIGQSETCKHLLPFSTYPRVPNVWGGDRYGCT